MYAITGVNAAAGTVTLSNPYGDSLAGSATEHATFTATLSQLEQEGVSLFFATGKAATT
jgi:hypothetical protein